ncbi:flagellar biosynthesis protein FlhB [Paenibacillus sp. YN15]|uniref:flagellar biosynthesis protein FlhB n=1 Tax=Paenibacillus sp. YN15 TaxID=1742774 RepID=UPI00215CF737|nr:flagellar biosynthesis protein FlhB [Paenibacillus sp. YN15]
MATSPLRYKLNLQLFAGEKTEPATPKKRADARKKGQVAKSAELPGALILLFCFMTLLMFGGYMKDRMFLLMQGTLKDYLTNDITVANVMPLMTDLLAQVLLLLAPIFAVTVLVGILANYMQIGFLLTGEAFKIKFSKINPIEGAKRIFSLKSLVDFAKTLLKLTLIGYLVYSSLWGEKENLVNLAHLPLADVLAYVARLTVMMGIKIGVALVILSIFDYMYQKYEYEKNLRMSKQDIKDEYKKSEGDPQIKGKIKEKQRRMALARMMQDVPKADVVITNPTHFAVAIQYDNGKMDAPRVVAKGTDFVALKIKEVAKENGVITMENRPLARALYDQVEIGQTIPAELFQAVAEVLAYVYRLKGRKAK